ncbi:ABC transporter ATP-binding protein [Roseibium aquae]|uniref:ABC transporter ATP-binding protein n=1 Tax=Roseibium aquae TaxID=1323746 RepID=A0A916TMY9_9HYPH|nr:ABC transporter ATP-binding protein [Roseibium aquae]GGB62839.1 ABC transporter ATP-binding protein [Roseibium aquae]
MASLLEIRDLHLSMHSFEGAAKVLSGVTLSVEKGQIWGLVGETGCGKSLTGLSVSRLVRTPPAEYTRGKILLNGTDVLTLDEPRMRALRGRRIGMIFQDPTTNLNPSFRISTQLIDVALAAARHDSKILGLPATAGRWARRQAARRLAIDMLTEVGIPDAATRVDDYPHQFSGGMRQRVLIAMALVGQPDLLIADEPTTALDVSVQAQILDLLKQMVTVHDMGVVLITHNLGVVAQTCTHVAVMYAGAIVEKGPIRAVLTDPAHPYTKALMQAIPRRDVARGALQGLPGAVPNLVQPPAGCRFAPRCILAQPSCSKVPAEHERAAGHLVACPVVQAAHHA